MATDAPTKAQERKSQDDLHEASVPFPERAEKLPEKDTVQKEIKAGMLAKTGKEEAQHKAKVVDESPDAAETPSGSALKKVAGEADDVERGEKYLAAKTAKRWGYQWTDEEDDE